MQHQFQCPGRAAKRERSLALISLYLPNTKWGRLYGCGPGCYPSSRPKGLKLHGQIRGRSTCLLSLASTLCTRKITHTARTCLCFFILISSHLNMEYQLENITQTKPSGVSSSVDRATTTVENRNVDETKLSTHDHDVFVLARLGKKQVLKVRDTLITCRCVHEISLTPRMLEKFWFCVHGGF